MDCVQMDKKFYNVPVTNYMENEWNNENDVMNNYCQDNDRIQYVSVWEFMEKVWCMAKTKDF